VRVLLDTNVILDVALRRPAQNFCLVVGVIPRVRVRIKGGIKSRR